MKKTMLLILFCAAIFSLSACDTDETTSSVLSSSEISSSEDVSSVSAFATISVKETSVTLDAEKTYTLEPETDVDVKLVYVSENPDIATVDENGVVTWKSEGQTNIVISSENANEVKVLVTCSAPVAEVVPETESSSSSASSEAVQMPENSASSSSSANEPSKPQGNGSISNDSSSSNSASSRDEVIELEDDHDQRKWEVGAGIKINDYYESGSSWEQVLADLQVLAKPYGLQVMKTGAIGNGSASNAGSIRVSLEDGSWKLYIYNWRTTTSNTGFSDVMNTTLQVMKYFLGDDNGANLWSFWDGIYTGQRPDPANYGITDGGDEIGKGTWTFSDGTVVVYDQTAEYQKVLTLR